MLARPAVALAVACLVGMLVVASASAAPAAGRKGSVLYQASTNTYQFVDGTLRTDAAAYGVFFDEFESTGWGRLQIATNGDFDDDVQAYAAGYLEGALTQLRIWQHYLNMALYTWQNLTMPDDVRGFFQRQREWTEEQAGEHGATDDYWHQVSLVLAQYDGLVAGYNAYAPSAQAIDSIDLQTANAFGDLFDIVPHLRPHERPHLEHKTPAEVMQYMATHGHCSAAVRVTPDLSDIFAGHASWFTYSAMLKVMKHFDMQFQRGSKSQRQVFSSYPGTLGSNDDYYLTDAGLNTIETTNGILNSSLYDLVTSQAVLCYQRVLVANRMAASSPEWVSIFSQHNSGTYNNQWIVLDFGLFTPGQPLAADTLWIAEQIPGYIESRDCTNHLYQGYWPSYNVPFFAEIYERTGYKEYEKKYGPSMSWGMCPRAQLFRELIADVDDIPTFQRFMRYNDFQHDPLAHDNPGIAISARFDLEQLATRRSADGAYDAKLSSFAYVSELTVFGVAGPTADQQPPFEWNDEFAHYAHNGQPTRWDFAWQKMVPTDLRAL